MGQNQTDEVKPVENRLFDNPSAFMSPQQAAEYLGVSRRTVYRLLRNDKLESFKVAGVWRISRQEIAKLTGRKEDIHAKSVS